VHRVVRGGLQREEHETSVANVIFIAAMVGNFVARTLKAPVGRVNWLGALAVGLGVSDIRPRFRGRVPGR
jgi:hypothetical protein